MQRSAQRMRQRYALQPCSHRENAIQSLNLYKGGEMLPLPSTPRTVVSYTLEILASTSFRGKKEVPAFFSSTGRRAGSTEVNTAMKLAVWPSPYGPSWGS